MHWFRIYDYRTIILLRKKKKKKSLCQDYVLSKGSDICRTLLIVHSLDKDFLSCHICDMIVTGLAKTCVDRFQRSLC